MQLDLIAGRPVQIALLSIFGTLLSSWWLFSGMWRGAEVSGAGEASLNGYYVWVPSGGYYLQNVFHVAPGTRGPDAFAISWLHPEFSDFDFTALFSDQTGKWGIGKPQTKNITYVSKEITTVEELPIPPSGSSQWEIAKGTNPKLAMPPPAVNVCWRQPPNPLSIKNRGKKREGISLFLSRPTTALLLAINLGVAYYLWSNRVDPDRVCISYRGFMSGEYWRVITASFSHFEIMHLGFNMMSLWNLGGLESHIGSFSYLYLSIDLVITTILAVIAMQHYLITRRGVEAQRNSKAVGYSCVLFSLMTYAAVVQNQYCPIPFIPSMCFDTWFIPNPMGVKLGVNMAPFAMLLMVQFIMPRAGFLGHLAGIIMGYPLVWGMLNWLTTPVLCLLCTVGLLQMTKAWPWQHMHDYNLLLNGWSEGDSRRVKWTKILILLLVMNVTAGVVAVTARAQPATVTGALLMLTALGWAVSQASKCCCSSDSIAQEHRDLLYLLKCLAINAAVLVICNIASIGAIVGKWCFLADAGWPEFALQKALLLLLACVVIHIAIVVVCGAIALQLREGQTFLSSIGFGRLVTHHTVVSAYEGGSGGRLLSSTGAPSSSGGVSGGSAIESGTTVDV